MIRSRTERSRLSAGLLCLAVCLEARAAPDLEGRVARVLTATPLIDGHNDLPSNC